MKRVISTIFTVLTILSCISENKTNVNSLGIHTSEQRIQEIKKYFKLRGNTIDVEFDIFDLNLYTSRVSIPGPTSRDYRVAILTDSEGVKLWIKDVQLAQDSFDFQWAKELVKDNPNFKIDTEASIYFSQNKEVIVFNESNVVLVRIIQN